MQSRSKACAEQAVENSSITAGKALRSEIINKITPLLAQSESIADSNMRLLVQACCLDVVTGLEDVIAAFKLDQHQA